MKNINPKLISLILSIITLVLWTIYGVIVLIRQELTLSDYVVTWVGVILMSAGNMVLSIADYKEKN